MVFIDGGVFMECYDCADIIGVTYQKAVRICGRCRKVVKYDLVRQVLAMDRIYLSEHNRNKSGRPSKIKDHNLRYKVAKLRKEGKSYREIGEICSISKDSARKIVLEYGSLIDQVE